MLTYIMMCQLIGIAPMVHDKDDNLVYISNSNLYLREEDEEGNVSIGYVSEPVYEDI